MENEWFELVSNYYNTYRSKLVKLQYVPTKTHQRFDNMMCSF